MVSTQKEKIIYIIIGAWTVLWLVFLIRPDKDGQYAELKHFHSVSYDNKVKHLLGDELYGFLMFSKDNIPEGSTYALKGFGERSIYEVRFRYYLWPLKSVEKGSDYIIIYGDDEVTDTSYNEYLNYKGDGRIYQREEASL